MAAALDRGETEFAARLVAESDRLEPYAEAGDIRAQKILGTVRVAARRLTMQIGS